MPLVAMSKEERYRLAYAVAYLELRQPDECDVLYAHALGVDLKQQDHRKRKEQL